jgi:hypothetical protein
MIFSSPFCLDISLFACLFNLSRTSPSHFSFFVVSLKNYSSLCWRPFQIYPHPTSSSPLRHENNNPSFLRRPKVGVFSRRVRQAEELVDPFSFL